MDLLIGALKNFGTRKIHIPSYGPKIMDTWLHGSHAVHWTPWDQGKVLEYPDFPGQHMYFWTSTKSVDFAGVFIFKCPH